ncbi:MAG: TlyA family RNA methyltransferase [Dethiobacteria bacterium]|jgi:23S rRNA (cytidine1920-2'-O)/16S rRNA (cytidine1409-2'-O)-methyltransferase
MKKQNMVDMSKEKKRLDLLLVDKNLVSSRSRARAEIMAGNVYVNGEKMEKPGLLFSPNSKVELRRPANPYVSRGGLKLEKALQEFAVDLEGKVVLDVGSSTGGFTDCALKFGAKKVYALDVGYGQLAWEIRKHPKVITMERFNVRSLKKDDLVETPDIATVDVSFISLRHVLPVLASLSVAEVICLVKPQFEAAPGQVGKKGVIRDPQIHGEVLKKVLKFASLSSYNIKGLTFSPLKGPKGNIEFFLYFVLGQEESTKVEENLVETIVSLAHKALNR